MLTMELLLPPTSLIMTLASFFHFKHVIIHHADVQHDDNAIEMAKSFLSGTLQSAIFTNLEECPSFVSKSHHRSAVLTQGMVPVDCLKHSQLVWILQDVEHAYINTTWLRYDSMVVTYSKNGFTFELEEWYSMKGARLERNKIGNWNDANGFVPLADHYIWKRRHDLSVIPLRYLTLPWPNFISLQEDINGKLTASGLYIDILEHLKGYINFTVNVLRPKDREWGYQAGEEGPWTGVVGELSRGEGDMASGLTVNKHRSDVIDFTLPILDEVITLIIHKAYERKIMDGAAFIKIFSSTVWFSIFLILTLASISSLALSSCYGGPLFYYFYIDDCITSLSAKVMYVITSTFCFVLFTYYTSDLTSTMTTGPIPKRIASFQDVLDSGDYRVLVVEGAIVHDRLAKAEEGSVMNRVFKKILHDNSNSLLESSSMLRERLLKDPKSVAYDNYLTFIHDSDRLTPLMDFSEVAHGQQGFGLQKDSELKEVLSYYLLKMMESGAMSKIIKRHFDIPPPDWSKQIFIVESPGAIAPANVALLTVILLGGIITATLLACAEVMVNKYRSC